MNNSTSRNRPDNHNDNAVSGEEGRNNEDLQDDDRALTPSPTAAAAAAAAAAARGTKRGRAPRQRSTASATAASPVDDEGNETKHLLPAGLVTQDQLPFPIELLDRPKRPLSAYNLFFQRQRQKFKAEEAKRKESSPAGPRSGREVFSHMGESSKMRRAEADALPSCVSRISRFTAGALAEEAAFADAIAEQWKNLGDEEKLEFEQEARENKIKHQQALDDWRKLAADHNIELPKRPKAKSKKQLEKEAARARQQQEQKECGVGPSPKRKKKKKQGRGKLKKEDPDQPSSESSSWGSEEQLSCSEFLDSEYLLFAQETEEEGSPLKKSRTTKRVLEESESLSTMIMAASTKAEGSGSGAASGGGGMMASSMSKPPPVTFAGANVSDAHAPFYQAQGQVQGLSSNEQNKEPKQQQQQNNQHHSLSLGRIISEQAQVVQHDDVALQYVLWNIVQQQQQQAESSSSNMASSATASSTLDRSNHGSASSSNKNKMTISSSLVEFRQQLEALIQVQEGHQQQQEQQQGQRYQLHSQSQAQDSPLVMGQPPTAAATEVKPDGDHQQQLKDAEQAFFPAIPNAMRDALLPPSATTPLVASKLPPAEEVAASQQSPPVESLEPNAFATASTTANFAAAHLQQQMPEEEHHSRSIFGNEGDHTATTTTTSGSQQEPQESLRQELNEALSQNVDSESLDWFIQHFKSTDS